MRKEVYLTFTDNPKKAFHFSSYQEIVELFEAWEALEDFSYWRAAGHGKGKNSLWTVDVYFKSIAPQLISNVICLLRND